MPAPHAAGRRGGSRNRPRHSRAAPGRGRLRLALGVVLFLAAARSAPGEAPLPGVGESATVNEIRVTLLGVKRLTQDEFRAMDPDHASEWAGGGLRLAFQVENRPDVPTPPVLGEVRVLFGRALYNPVTNAVSRKPFAPGIAIYDASDFFRGHGRGLQRFAPAPRARTVASVLDVFIRGGPVQRRADGVAELEQGETHIRKADGSLSPADMKNVKYVWFRFRLPALD